MQPAISYIRFSSAAQSDGDSLRRQLEMTRSYALKHRLTLDESLTYRDLGVSGWKGKNRTEGMLKSLLDAIRGGRIKPGTALLVERLDRLTREGCTTGIGLMMEILKAGVDVHAVSTGRIFTMPKNSTQEFTASIEMGMEFFQAALENEKKSERLGEVWSEKKVKSPLGISITEKLPGWLDGKTGEPITVDKDKAKIVRRIFEMAAAGQGTRLIARRLNEQGVSTFGRGKRKSEKWIQSYVRKILCNRATLGEFQPYKGKGRNRVKDGAPRLDFFPAVITPELWDRAHRAISSRRTTTDNGETTGKYPGRTGKLYNLFSGLVHDATLGLPMYWRDKGKRDKPRLVTNSKDLDGTTPNTVPYAPFEKAFLNWLDQLDWTTVIDIADSSEIKQMEEEVASLDLQIARTEAQIQTLVDSLVTLSTPAVALNARLLKLEAKVAEDKAAKESAEKRLATVKSKHRDLLDESILYEKLSKAKDLETRSRLRQEIRRKVARIDVYFDKKATHFLGESLAKVYFVNGVERWIAFGSGLAAQIKLDETRDYLL